jgi:hypothetical protein
LGVGLSRPASYAIRDVRMVMVASLGSLGTTVGGSTVPMAGLETSGGSGEGPSPGLRVDQLMDQRYEPFCIDRFAE